jgi:uracil phosphoribosyltransferase
MRSMQPVLSDIYGPHALEARKQFEAISVPLDGYMPEGFGTLKELDEKLLDLNRTDMFRLVNDEDYKLDEYKDLARIKGPRLRFRHVIDKLAERVVGSCLSEYGGISAVVLPLRAAGVFEKFATRHKRDVDVSTLYQTRVERKGDMPYTITFDNKIGNVEGKTVLLPEVMLATGGSMIEVMKILRKMGAKAVVTASIFTAPQGLVNVATSEQACSGFWVGHISPRLDAGMPRDTPYIVSEYIPKNNKRHNEEMLGDAGDRIYGPPANDIARAIELSTALA